jgi:hypothetical protein
MRENTSPDGTAWSCTGWRIGRAEAVRERAEGNPFFVGELDVQLEPELLQGVGDVPFDRPLEEREPA